MDTILPSNTMTDICRNVSGLSLDDISGIPIKKAPPYSRFLPNRGGLSYSRKLDPQIFSPMALLDIVFSPFTVLARRRRENFAFSHSSDTIFLKKIIISGLKSQKISAFGGFLE